MGGPERLLRLFSNFANIRITFYRHAVHEIPQKSRYSKKGCG
jgi:hypothetical protein